MAFLYNEYRVVWCECPTSLHSNRVLFVKAKNEPDALMHVVHEHEV